MTGMPGASRRSASVTTSWTLMSAAVISSPDGLRRLVDHSPPAPASQAVPAAQRASSGRSASVCAWEPCSPIT